MIKNFTERAARALCERNGEDPETWPNRAKDVGDVLTAIKPLLADGGRVHIPGVGMLTTRLKRRKIHEPHPEHRGKAIEERIAMLSKPAKVWAGEPYEVA